MGTDENTIYCNVKLLLEDVHEYEKMCQANNPYGDGLFASKKLRI